MPNIFCLPTTTRCGDDELDAIHRDILKPQETSDGPKLTIAREGLEIEW